jgi:protein phosphatase
MTPQADDVFILCSDGLTTHLEDEEIAQRVCGESDLESAAAGLVDAANRAGGADNTTVLLVRYEKET